MTDVEAYISKFDPDVKERLSGIRDLIFHVVPEVEESMRYNMPAFRTSNAWLYVAAYKKHIGLYPVYGLNEIQTELAPYKAKGTKDTLHFHHHLPLPFKLIKKIIVLKLKETI